MEIQYYLDYSPALERDMECKSYGHGGKPVLFIPCQDGRFYDFENFGMLDVWAPWIEAGEVMVFSIDTIDAEAWSNQAGHPAWRIRRFEQWVHYITDELVPFIRWTVNECNGEEGEPGILVFGCSLGAGHAANLFFRRPDLFDSVLALSGVYTAEYGFGSYMDELVYLNSPVHYIPNMAPDHPYIEMYNQRRSVFCTGLGPWELPDYTRALQWALESKGIHAWVDYWGTDVRHDWDWWYREVEYFLPYLLGEDEEEE